jgi:hypothetical protein
MALLFEELAKGFFHLVPILHQVGESSLVFAPIRLVTSLAYDELMLRRFLLMLMVVLGLSGVFLWSQSPKEWRQVATLTNDVSEGQTLLDVKWMAPGQASRLILLESPDGSQAEVSAIEHIYGNNIVLKRRLKNDFARGSSLYQQGSEKTTY